MSGVYQIQSIIKPDKIYIGSAVNIERRWQAHLSCLKRNIHHSSKLQNHYNKYGKNDLMFSILICCDVEDLLVTEQYYLDTVNPFFNICKVAGSSLGVKLSEESKDKLRKTQIRKYKEYVEKFGRRVSWNKGMHWKQSAETIRRKSESLKGNTNTKGKLRSEESKLKQSISRKGKYVGIDHKESKPVVQYDKKMNIINKYISITDASSKTKIHTDSISRCAMGKYKTAGGFIWKYYKE